MITAAELRERWVGDIPSSTIASLCTTLSHVLTMANDGKYHATVDHHVVVDADKSDFDIIEKQFKARGYNVKRTGILRVEISW